VVRFSSRTRDSFVLQNIETAVGPIQPYAHCILESFWGQSGQGLKLTNEPSQVRKEHVTVLANVTSWHNLALYLTLITVFEWLKHSMAKPFKCLEFYFCF
jgi:hypothetical protein